MSYLHKSMTVSTFYQNGRYIASVKHEQRETCKLLSCVSKTDMVDISS